MTERSQRAGGGLARVEGLRGPLHSLCTHQSVVRQREHACSTSLHKQPMYIKGCEAARALPHARYRPTPALRGALGTYRRVASSSSSRRGALGRALRFGRHPSLCFVVLLLLASAFLFTLLKGRSRFFRHPLPRFPGAFRASHRCRSATRCRARPRPRGDVPRVPRGPPPRHRPRLSR